VDVDVALGSSARKDLGEMPEVSEIEIIRHYTRLSTWNYASTLACIRWLLHHEVQPARE